MLTPGQVLQNKYTIEKELGRGGFGITYLAQNKRGEKIAIKILNNLDLTQPDYLKNKNDLFNEALKLKSFGHPNIVKVYEIVEEANNIIWIVMEYIEGESLNGKQLTESEAIVYIHQVGDALTAIHQQELLHLDVTPSNIMVRHNKEEVVLIDFGLSRQWSARLTQIYTVQNTPFYSALELYNPHQPRTPATDVYSLAATLYKLTTGKEPEGAPSRAYGCPLKEPQKINPQINNNTNLAIMLGLELKPEDRPQSIKEFLELLDSPIGQIYLDGKREQKTINQLRVNSSPEFDSAIRVYSINELAKYKDKANNAIPELINYLKEKDDIISGAAYSTLSQIGSAAALLAKVMNDKKESLEVRKRAASIVSIIGAENNAAVPELIEAVGDADAEIAWYAVVTIGKIALEARDAIPALIKKLGAQERGIRAYSAYALGRMGQDAQEAIPDLLKLINGNESDAVFLASLEALEAIGYDIKEIKFSIEGKETSGNEYVIFYREEQRRKQKEEEKKPGIRIPWIRVLSMDTPPQTKSECLDEGTDAGYIIG